MGTKNHARAVRYRQLALTETDSAKADLLCLLAEEAERDVLCTVDRSHDGLPKQQRQLKCAYPSSSFHFRWG
ncbi:hypothetical protein [Bradyrhizobium sp.]|uniref:hypothetical protein n=1 Tax=Bradyrhizobium sp. TaxID=376 RepID=UPI003BB049BC